MKYRLLLLLAALIWGFAFVAQVIGMDSIGPYAFNGIRFLLGSLSLLPIIYYYPSGRNPKEASFSIWVAILMAGILLCGVLFLNESFTGKQLIGILCMTAGVFLAQIPSRTILPLKK